MAKKCQIEIRYRDGKVEVANSKAEAKFKVQNARQTAIIEQVCTLQFCIAGKCINLGKKRRR